jgi:hypothetical protein
MHAKDTPFEFLIHEISIISGAFEARPPRAGYISRHQTQTIKRLSTSERRQVI